MVNSLKTRLEKHVVETILLATPFLMVPKSTDGFWLLLASDFVDPIFSN